MGKKIYYRVKFPAWGEVRKQVALYALSRCFSLKKVLLIEGLSLVLSLLTFLPYIVGGHAEFFVILSLPLLVLAIHLWAALFWMLSAILGVRYPKNIEGDLDGQFTFMENSLMAEGFGPVQELPYSRIENVRETRGCFCVKYRGHTTFLFLKKNFLEGDPATFADFLKNACQEPGHSSEVTEADEMRDPAAAIFESEVTENEELYIRNRVLESSWIEENISAAGFLVNHLVIYLMILPVWGICTAPMLWGKDRSVGVFDIIVWMIPQIIYLAVIAFFCKKRGIDYARYRQFAVRVYQQTVKNGTALTSTSYRFFEESFYVQLEKANLLCKYTDICRMYRTEQHLILLVGTTAGATAMALDKAHLGEDCERLMNFLKEKSGLEWMDSPV